MQNQKNFLKDSVYECDCFKCWKNPPKTLIYFNQWLTIEFQSHKDLNDFSTEKIREKVAQWINEECAIIRCNQITNKFLLHSENILIGGIEQYLVNNQTYFLYLNSFINILNKTGKLMNNQINFKENFLNLSVLSGVIRSREHLLSAILNGNIQAIYVSKRENQRKNPPLWHLFVYAGFSLISAFIVSLTTLLIFTCCFVNWKINWNKILHNKYNRNLIKKKIKG